MFTTSSWRCHSPRPPPGGNTVFVVGRTFGAPGSDVLDVWVDDTVSNSYDPPDGAAITLPIRTLIACTHGWLRFVAAGQPVPGPAHAGRVAAHRDRRNARAPGLADAAR